MILAKRFFTADDTYLRCNLHDSHCRFHWIVKSLFHGLVRIVLVNQKIEHLRHICWDSTKVSAFVLLFCGNKVSTIYNNMCKLLYCCVSFPIEVSLFLLLPAVHVWSIICVKVWVRLTFKHPHNWPKAKLLALSTGVTGAQKLDVLQHRMPHELKLIIF